MYYAETVYNALFNILLEQGIGEKDAQITAEVLLDGTLKGYNNHGVERIFQILYGIKCKTLNRHPNRRIVREGESYCTIDADGSLGQPAAIEAMEVAVEKARNTGISFVGVINAGHVGVLSYYAELASAQDCLGIVLSTSSPASVVPGGSTAVLGTNPIAYSFPLENSFLTADFSTTAVSRGAIMEHKEKNRKIPIGWAVDAVGNATDEPNEALMGGILPYGGEMKGTLLSLLFATLAGPLIGGSANHKVTGTRFMEEMPNKGDVFICIDIKKFTHLKYFFEENNSLLNVMKESSNEFHIPGSGSYARKLLNSNMPIMLSPKLKELLSGYVEEPPLAVNQ